MNKHTGFELDTHSALRAAIIAGEQSGPSEPFDFDGFIAATSG